MKEYISEGRAMYEDANHGLFSKRLAQWAISNMEVKDPATGDVKPLKAPTVDEVREVLNANDVKIPEEFIYTALYLYAMAKADYPKTLSTDKLRAMYVDETLCDPDGCPENVLACFEAKMGEAGVPIYWEKYL